MGSRCRAISLVSIFLQINGRTDSVHRRYENAPDLAAAVPIDKRGQVGSVAMAECDIQNIPYRRRQRYARDTALCLSSGQRR